MLSDPQGAIGSLYSVFDEQKQVDARGRFLIDPEGVVRSMEIITDVAGRNVTEILRQLRALHYNRATGDFMPCGWEPGKPTIPVEPETTGEDPHIAERWNTRNAF